MASTERRSTFTRFPPLRHPRRVRAVAVVVAVLIVAIVVGSVVLFIEPATNAPARSDAVIVLAGGNDAGRVAKGLALVRAGYAPRLIVSAPSHQNCPESLPSVSITCFDPNPKPPKVRLGSPPRWPSSTTGIRSSWCLRRRR